MVTQMKKDLDAEEAQIKAGTHAGLLAELQAIEDRRKARIRIIEAERDYRQKMWENGFQAVCKAANDQYHVRNNRYLLLLFMSLSPHQNQECPWHD